jgi:OFA family oxalate/formate antiporter-like MFS transporter
MLFFGFSIVLIEVVDAFHIGLPNVTTGVDDPRAYTPVGGAPLYAFAASFIFQTITFITTASSLFRIGPRRMFSAGLCCITVGMTLSAAAIQVLALWLLYVGWSVIAGVGYGLIFTAVATPAMLWHRAIGNPGLGAGYIGFCSGIWAASLAFVWPALYSSVGLYQSFYILMGMVTAIAFPACFAICTPSEYEEHEDAKSEPTTGESKLPAVEGEPGEEEHAAATAAVEPTPLSMRQVLATPRFWYQWVLLFLAFAPGFGIKFMVTPLMRFTFDIDSLTLELAQGILLICYAISRMITGLILGKGSVSACRIFTAAMGLQCPTFIGAALLITYGERDSTASAWGFIVLCATIGSTLGSCKVALTVFALTEWGVQNLATANGALLSAFGLAGFLGPVTCWIAITTGGLEPKEQRAGASAWLWVNAAISSVAFLLALGLDSPCRERRRHVLGSRFPMGPLRMNHDHFTHAASPFHHFTRHVISLSFLPRARPTRHERGGDSSAGMGGGTPFQETFDK